MEMEVLVGSQQGAGVRQLQPPQRLRLLLQEAEHAAGRQQPPGRGLQPGGEQRPAAAVRGRHQARPAALRHLLLPLQQETENLGQEAGLQEAED